MSGNSLSEDATELRSRLFREIEQDLQQGASELARQCLRQLNTFARHLCREAHALTPEQVVEELLSLSQQLQQSRPSMAPLSNLLQLWQSTVTQNRFDNLHALEQAVTLATETIIQESLQATASIAEHAVQLIKDGATVMTHSRSSSVLKCFERLAKKHKNIQAIVTESRPGMEGRQLAKELAQLNITTHFITEAQIGLFVPRADVVLVGADTVLADAGLVNKSGTYLLALAAKANQVPFYACCENAKYSHLVSDTIHLESQTIEELQAPTSDNAELIQPHNIYFDITPAKLISAYITEHGLHLPETGCELYAEASLADKRASRGTYSSH